MQTVLIHAGARALFPAVLPVAVVVQQLVVLVLHVVQLDLLEHQYHNNLDAHALVLETKEEVLRSLLKQVRGGG